MIRTGAADVWDGIWTGAVWRPPPGKRGVSFHAALVARPCSCIRRLAGTRAREIQFTRFLRNHSVTAAEMACHAGERTAARAAGRDVVVIQDTSELALGGWRVQANSITNVSDRESDIYEHFARRSCNVDLIVRACQNRQVETDDEDQINLL